MPPAVELGGETVRIGINIHAVQIPVDGGQGDVNFYVVYSDVLKWGLFEGATRQFIAIGEYLHKRRKTLGPTPHYSGLKNALSTLDAVL